MAGAAFASHPRPGIKLAIVPSVTVTSATPVMTKPTESTVLHEGSAVPSTQRQSEPVFCSEPAIFRRPAAIAAKRPAEPRGAQLWSRMAAARDADPEPVLRAMGALDDAEVRLLTVPGNSKAAGRAVIARASLEHAARAFVRAAVTSP